MTRPEASQAELARTVARALADRPEILEAYLFGSRARGAAHPLSDVDVAVYVDRERVPEAAFGYRAALTADPMAALGTDAVDVVVLNDAPPLLYHRVLMGGLRLFARDPAATTVREARALSRYCDLLPALPRVEAVERRRRGYPRDARTLSGRQRLATLHNSALPSFAPWTMAASMPYGGGRPPGRSRSRWRPSRCSR